jgi:hypothetical protein
VRVRRLVTLELVVDDVPVVDEVALLHTSHLVLAALSGRHMGAPGV